MDVPKKLRDRTHNCPSCGLVIDRDENAAVNILNRGGAVPKLGNVADNRERLTGNVLECSGKSTQQIPPIIKKEINCYASDSPDSP